ncbi:MAG TPA: sigma-54 dependent transcriptional regulator [Thermoanaerobaculia bacterium]
MALLLLVEDERLLRWALRTKLQAAGHVVHEATTLTEAEQQLRRMRPQVVILDVHLPDGNGLDFLAAQRERLFESSVLVFTADGNIEDAVRAMKLGAYDFLTKPVDHDELLKQVAKAAGRFRERLEVEGSRRAREKQARVHVVADSEAMRSVLQLATTVAGAGTTTVLLHGETGVGKEVIARYIHSMSPRSSASLQALNCAALPEQLVESELFGYEKGAFTDAKASRKGLFELADGGTVVLDEIGEIPLTLQAKLLRFLEDRTFRRLGGTREIAVDVRVIAMTNRSLVDEVAQRRFREDLFHRLHVFPIRIPPLRERRADIIPLAIEFLKHYGVLCGKPITQLSEGLKERLLEHPWSGNVRELRNLIERAVILEEGTELSNLFLPLAPGVGERLPVAKSGDDEPIIPLEEVEFIMVQRALRATGGNQSQAARLLQVSRDQLRYRVKRYRELGRLEADSVADDAMN